MTSTQDAGSSVLSLCEGTLRVGGVDESIDAASAAGFSMMQFQANRVAEVGAGHLAGRLSDVGIGVSSLYAGGVQPLGESNDDILYRAIEDAAALGTGVIGLHPGPLGRLSHADAAKRTAEWFAERGARAAAAGLVLAMEPIHPIMRHFSWVHTVRQAAELVRGVDGAALLVDVSHVWWDPNLVDDFRDNVDLVAGVQLADVDFDALTELRYARAPLGDGDVGVSDLITAFRGAGFRGPFELELIMRIRREDRVGFFRSQREWFDGRTGG
jgi:sugar phosphate isomerase/epimerase